MADVINLNKARKQKAKKIKNAKAEENCTQSGLTKAQKSKNTIERNVENNRLDGLRIYRPKSGDDKKDP
jgi:hypothetical protein